MCVHACVYTANLPCSNVCNSSLSMKYIWIQWRIVHIAEKKMFEVKSLAWNVKSSFWFNKVRFQSWRTERIWDLNQHCASPKSKRKAPNPNLPTLVLLLFCWKKLMRLKEVIDTLIFSPLVLQFWMYFNVSFLTCSFWAVLIGLMT